MVKNKPFEKRFPKTNKGKDLELPVWTADGFVGILGLMIYNFILYLLKIAGAGGIIAKMEETMGYFTLNTFVDLGFSPGEMFFGLIITLIVSFLLGVFIAKIVRKNRKR
jgi:ABC-type antimicrobial peptide transport system permease subunit